MTKEKRPQDWNQEEKLNLVIRCGSVDEAQISQLCRELSAKTLQRWQQRIHQQDGRLEAKHNPRNKLREFVRQRILAVFKPPLHPRNRARKPPDVCYFLTAVAVGLDTRHQPDPS